VPPVPATVPACCRQRRSDKCPHLPRATPRHFDLAGRRQVGAAVHVNVVSVVCVSPQGAYHRPPFEPALVANRPQFYNLVALPAPLLRDRRARLVRPPVWPDASLSRGC
jgi:hypothetical protein